MSKFMIIGGIIGIFGAIIVFGFEQKWGFWVVVGGTLIALPSLFGF